METWEERARERAYHPDDEELRRAARQFIGIHFGGCVQRTTAFFDELARELEP